MRAAHYSRRHRVGTAKMIGRWRDEGARLSGTVTVDAGGPHASGWVDRGMAL